MQGKGLKGQREFGKMSKITGTHRRGLWDERTPNPTMSIFREGTHYFDSSSTPQAAAMGELSGL